MMSISLNVHPEGAIIVIDYPEENIYNEYAISEESAMAIYDVLGNVVDLAEPILSMSRKVKRKKK